MGAIPTEDHRNLKKSPLQSSTFRITQPFQAIPTLHPGKRGRCLKGPHPKARRNSTAYLSEQLDSTAKGWSPCVRALGALSLLSEEALKIALGAPIWVLTAHQVPDLFNNQASAWVLDNRILRYQILLFETHRYPSVFIGL